MIEKIVELYVIIKNLPIIKRFFSKNPKFWQTVQFIAGAIYFLALGYAHFDEAVKFLMDYDVTLNSHLLLLANRIIWIAGTLGIASQFTIKGQPKIQLIQPNEQTNK